MSYKTNPNNNRLKIIKGWKNPYLPTKNLNYTRDISLWFKVYIFLKTFLNLKKIQLFSCEIRFDEQNKKILYLVINKKKKKRKKIKKKFLFLKKTKTPLKKNRIFYLYNNLNLLKKLSFWNQNPGHTKILTKLWLTKPKFFTWLNTLEKIKSTRQNLQKVFKYSKKNKNFAPKQHLKIKFYTNKQRQLLAQIARLKKKNTFLNQKLFYLLQQKKIQVFQEFIKNLSKKINNNQIHIQRTQKIYNFLVLLNIKTLNSYEKIFSKKSFKKSIFNRIQRKKLVLLWKLLKNKVKLFNQTSFLKKQLPTLLLEVNKNIFFRKKNINWRFSKKDSLLKNVLFFNFLVSQMYNKNFLVKNTFFLSNFISNFKIKQTKTKKIYQTKSSLEYFFIKPFVKSKFLKNAEKNILQRNCLRNTFYKTYFWLLLRLKKQRTKKKRKFKKLNKKIGLTKKKIFFSKYPFFFANQEFFVKKKTKRSLFKKYLLQTNSTLKKSRIAKYYQYRLPYRKIYFNFVKINTNLYLKYLIQSLVKKHFSIEIETKIVHILNSHKNKNYFRLVFPVWKKKINKWIKKFRTKSWKQKQIFLMSKLNLAILTKNKNKQKSAKNNTKFLKKKDAYILAIKKIKKKRITNGFQRIKRNKDFHQSFKYFIPTLMYFSRTLDPQPLANLLAKVVFKAKKQSWLLSTLQYILKIIKLNSNVGYKIALAGRINSADKSRLIYITRKNVPLQVFDKNMNFAYSQAKARIGVFGIKIWVYF